MRQFRIIAVGFLLVALLILFPAARRYCTFSNAEPYPQGLPGWFRQFDEDHDGQLSIQEWLKGGRKQEEFQLIDQNGDGFVTADEMLHYVRDRIISKEKERRQARVNLPRGLPQWFREFDKDHDGQVSLAEWLKGGRKHEDFLRYDHNGDGFITADEVLQMMQKVYPLPLDGGRVNYQGAIAEATDEVYQGRRTFKTFSVRLEEGRIYQIDQVSQVFYSFLFLEDPNGTVVAQNNSGGVGQTARIVYEAPQTGTYRVIATSQDGVKTGDFTLSISVVRVSDNMPPTDADPPPPVRDPDDIYPKGLPPWFKELDENHDGQVSLAEWHKGGFQRDAFLLLDQNDDGLLTPDEVLKLVKRADRLALVKGQVNCKGTVEESAEERYDGKKSFKILTIKLEAGKTYQIEALSEAYYSYLYLEDPSGAVVAEHNSGGFGLTARIVHKAEEGGTYRIIITSLAGIRTGDFTLSVHALREGVASGLLKGLPPWFKQLDEDEDGQISLAEWLKGGRTKDEFQRYDANGDGLVTADEVLKLVKKSDLLKFEGGKIDYRGTIEAPTAERYQGKRAFKILTVKLVAGKIYQIEQVSQVYYSFLYLEDPNGNLVAEHNSGGVGQTARIIHEAEETGTYRIIATSQDGVLTGDFALSVRVVHDADAGPLPSVPAWFKDLDRDRDGQVSLAEWVQGGRKRDEFQLYDTNGDGLITAEEALHYLRAHPESKDKGKVRR